jgi:hypothetical protein
MKIAIQIETRGHKSPLCGVFPPTLDWADADMQLCYNIILEL